MKFLVLAFFVCASSTVTLGRGNIPAPVILSLLGGSVSDAQPLKPVVKTAAYNGVESEAPVLRSDSEVKADGFNYVYETGNGISAQSSGTLKKVDNVDVLTVEGAFQYSSPDGTPFYLTYVADENGYQPKSDALPVGPPMPEAIRRALEYVLAHPPKEETKKY